MSMVWFFRLSLYNAFGVYEWLKSEPYPSANAHSSKSSPHQNAYSTKMVFFKCLYSSFGEIITGASWIKSPFLMSQVAKIPLPYFDFLTSNTTYHPIIMKSSILLYAD